MHFFPRTVPDWNNLPAHIVTGNYNTIQNVCSTEFLGKSHHVVLTFDYCYQLNVPIATYTRYLYDKDEYESLCEELLSTDWKALFQDLNVSAT